MATFQQALSPERGMMRPDDIAALVSQLPASFPARPRPAHPMRAELQTMLAQNDLAGIRGALDISSIMDAAIGYIDVDRAANIALGSSFDVVSLDAWLNTG